MYVFDTNVFRSFGLFYPKRFPTIWDRLNELVDSEDLISTREVYLELENQIGDGHVREWVDRQKHIFKIPTNEECVIVSGLFQDKECQGLVKAKNILKGYPVADPFVIALAKVRGFCVVTQETANRMPRICRKVDVECVNIERFLEKEDLGY